jgi:hypothetical protein
VIQITDQPSAQCQYDNAMDNGPGETYRVVRKLEDGQEVFVASRKDLLEAEQLIASLMECWPGDYSIQGTDSLSRAFREEKPVAPPGKRPDR